MKRVKNRDADADRKSKPVISELKARKSRRTLCLTPELVDALKRHRGAHKQRAGAHNAQAAQGRAQQRTPSAGQEWTEHGLIFSTALGSPPGPDTLSDLFSKLARKAGLGHWHPHELRHSGASLVPARGTPLHVVSDVLGHASVAITKDLYGNSRNRIRRAKSGGPRGQSGIQPRLRLSTTWRLEPIAALARNIALARNVAALARNVAADRRGHATIGARPRLHDSSPAAGRDGRSAPRS